MINYYYYNSRWLVVNKQCRKTSINGKKNQKPKLQKFKTTHHQKDLIKILIFNFCFYKTHATGVEDMCVRIQDTPMFLIGSQKLYFRSMNEFNWSWEYLKGTGKRYYEIQLKIYFSVFSQFSVWIPDIFRGLIWSIKPLPHKA